MREFMKSLKDFVLRENDIERNGHIYCKVCGNRVDGELCFKENQREAL